MARSRNIKPGFFTNEDLAECSLPARLLFCGLWCLADREGRLEDRPKRIKAALLPYDNADCDQLLRELEERDFIVRYEHEGSGFIWIISFHKHQKPHHMEEPSSIPPPPGVVNKYNHSPVTKAQRLRIFERDGHKCVECNSTKQLQIDHIKPISKGGTSDDGNLRSLCRRCNEKKGNREQVVNDSSSTQGRIDTPHVTYIGNQQSVSRNQESGIKRGEAFVPPSVNEVAEYCSERGNSVDAEAFVAFYQSKGWKIGKNAMKDWRSAIVTWEKYRKQNSTTADDPRGNIAAAQRYLQEVDDG